jgi:hypothetical protein
VLTNRRGEARPGRLATGGGPAIRRWFDGLMDEDIPEADGTLDTARRSAAALARRAKADKTRRAYRAGVRAVRLVCPPRPPCPARYARGHLGFLSERRYPPPPAKPRAVNTVKLRAAAMPGPGAPPGLAAPAGARR